MGKRLIFVVYDSMGDVIMAGSKQPCGFHGLNTAECTIFRLPTSLEVEGDIFIYKIKVSMIQDSYAQGPL